MTAFLGGNPLSYEGVKATNPAQVIQALRNPLATDIGFDIGTEWVNTVSSTVWFLTHLSGGVATWSAAGSGTVGAIVTLTGGSGGGLSPTVGNFNLLGTANQITSTGAGSTITFSIPATFIAPGSIASTTTITSGTALVSTTTLTTGQGITATTGNIVATAGNISATVGSVAAGSTVTAGTSITATAGNITATNGNLVISTAGKKLSIATGANASIGTSAAMTAGAIVVSTTAVTASSIIVVAHNTLGGTPGAVSAPSASIIAGTSFAIASSSNTDTSTVNWWIVN